MLASLLNKKMIESVPSNLVSAMMLLSCEVKRETIRSELKVDTVLLHSVIRGFFSLSDLPECCRSPDVKGLLSCDVQSGDGVKLGLSIASGKAEMDRPLI